MKIKVHHCTEFRYNENSENKYSRNNSHLSESNILPILAHKSETQPPRSQCTNFASIEDHSNTSQNISLNTYYEAFSNVATKQVLLSRATVLIIDSVGNVHECTALLDSGSQSNVITESLCKQLNLNLTNVSFPIGGIGLKVFQIKYKFHSKIIS